MRLGGILAAALLVGLWTACSSTDFGAPGSKAKSSSKDQGGDGGDGDDTAPDDTDEKNAGLEDDSDGSDDGSFSPVENGSDTGNATSVEEDSATGNRKETFELGPSAKVQLVDYLFIMDNSCSMKDIIDKTRNAFESLDGKDVFPKKSLLAAMNTMPGNPKDLSKVHPSISGYPGVESEPGFLAFVDKERIAAYKKAAGPGNGGKWTLAGCDDAWFKPGQKNDKGESCLAAATQQTYHCVGTEAGIHAYADLLKKNDGKAVFRKGASVNVVFVSDTHDPGKPVAALKTHPDYKTLKEATKKDNVFTSLKFHSIVPLKKYCTDENQQGTHGYSYNVLVDEAKGIKGDVCSDDATFKDIAKQVVEAGKEAQDAVFVLSKEAKEVVSVKVDGADAEYELNDDKDTITIEGLDDGKEHEIVVVYAP